MTLAFKRDYDYIGSYNGEPLVTDDLTIINSSEFMARDVKYNFRILYNGEHPTNSIELIRIPRQYSDLKPRDEITFSPRLHLDDKIDFFNPNLNPECIWKISYKDVNGRIFSHCRRYIFRDMDWESRDIEETRGTKCKLFNKFYKEKEMIDISNIGHDDIKITEND